MAEALQQETIDELVERFYDKLTKDEYFITLFSNKGVDIENLKNRQRVFLARLASNEAPKSEERVTNQVKKTHSFHISQDGATRWMNTMIETVNELDIRDEQKRTLIGRIRHLLTQMV